MNVKLKFIFKVSISHERLIKFFVQNLPRKVIKFLMTSLDRWGLLLHF